MNSNPTTAHSKMENTAVGMGQVVMASEPTRLTTILGSCIAVVLYSPQHRLGMLSHVVLPHSTGPTTYPAKLADTAVPHMVTALHARGVKSSGLMAKIAGGACMFGDGKLMQIGESNVQAALQALASAQICVVGQDVGGNAGRRICFDLITGSLAIESVGHPSYTI